MWKISFSSKREQFQSKNQKKNYTNFHTGETPQSRFSIFKIPSD